MIIRCPNCGKKVVIGGLGRKPLNIPVTNVCDALQIHRSVMAAADELNCSRAFIYKTLKTHGLKLKDVVRGSVNPGSQKAISMPLTTFANKRPVMITLDRVRCDSRNK